MANKNQLLIDLNSGIVGTFMGFLPAQEDGHVIPKYRPFNSFRTFRYTRSIHRNDIKYWNPPNNGIPGIDPQYMIICANDRDTSFINVVNKLVAQENRDLKEQVKQLRLSRTTAERDSEIALAGVEGRMAQLRKLENKRNSGVDLPNYPFRKDFEDM